MGPIKSPVESMLNKYFANAAVEREVQKHDRWVIESLVYLARLNGTSSYEEYRGLSKKPVTLVVLTVNRVVPYLAVLVSLLLRGHHPSVLMKNMDLHIVNIERRSGRERYYLFEELRQKLPFVQFHNWTAKYPQHMHLEKPDLADERLDYIRALQLCELSGSRWCVVLEDDAIVPVDFANKFLRYVDRDIFPNASVSGLEDVSLDQVLMVKLYSRFNPFVSERWEKRRSKAGRQYEKKGNITHERLSYENNRAVDWREAQDMGIPLRKISYKIQSTEEWQGTVANAYPSVRLNETIALLEREDGRRGIATDISLGKALVRRKELARLSTVPSLVNHLGFYSEKLGGKNWRHADISTDIRFQLDDGPGVAAFDGTS